MNEIVPRLRSALEARAALLESLAASDTDCYRLFHGTVEGLPGVTVDRYGDVLFVQTFHTPLAPETFEAIRGFYAEHHAVCSDAVAIDRSGGHSRVNDVVSVPEDAALRDRVIRELGVSYRFRGQHRGHDPWLFLDLRAARRYVQANSNGRSVLNLFAYTCGVGVCAARAGASRVLNVDFATSSLAVGESNAALNDVSATSAFLASDFFPAVRQLAGLGLPRDRRRGPPPPTPIVPPESFDLVFLDPPRYAKSAFGVVDLVNDYGSVAKPALLATREGGTLVCCNNVARVPRDAWASSLEGSVRRNGRTLRGIEFITPDADFPSPDGNPPLKLAVLHV